MTQIPLPGLSPTEASLKTSQCPIHRHGNKILFWDSLADGWVVSEGNQWNRLAEGVVRFDDFGEAVRYLEIQP